MYINLNIIDFEPYPWPYPWGFSMDTKDTLKSIKLLIIESFSFSRIPRIRFENRSQGYPRIRFCVTRIR
jgi:hypothetical protein